MGTFLGSPVVAGYLMAKNYKAWGDEDSAKRSMIFGLVGTIFIVAVIVLLPEEMMSKVPNYLLPIIYTAVVQGLAEHYQSDQIEQHLENGHGRESYWKAAGFGMVGCVIILAVLLPVSIYQPLYEGELKTYGPQQHEIYFDENVSPYLSDSLASSLYGFGYFNGSAQGAAHIGRRSEHYVITLPIQKQMWDDSELISALQYLKDNVESKFETERITIRMHHISSSEEEFREI